MTAPNRAEPHDSRCYCHACNDARWADYLRLLAETPPESPGLRRLVESVVADMNQAAGVDSSKERT